MKNGVQKCSRSSFLKINGQFEEHVYGSSLGEHVITLSLAKTSSQRLLSNVFIRRPSEILLTLATELQHSCPEECVSGQRPTGHANMQRQQQRQQRWMVFSMSFHSLACCWMFRFRLDARRRAISSFGASAKFCVKHCSHSFSNVNRVMSGQVASQEDCEDEHIL